MSSWREELLQAVLGGCSERDLLDRIAAIGYDLGFDYCAYGLRAPIPISRPKVVMLNNYPVAWMARYVEQGYLAVDPTVRHGMRSLFPIVWSDDVFESVPELWEEARSFGLSVGWAQSSRDASGVGGMLTLARTGDPLSESELRAKSLKMSWLAQVAHQGMARILVPKLLAETEVRLTQRELSVLRWTGDGKTACEIAEILGISESTVTFHIRNAVAKLGTVNKLAATVKAAMLGMLY